VTRQTNRLSALDIAGFLAFRSHPQRLHVKLSLIAEIDQRIDHLLEPCQQEVELLMTMPGVKKETAAVVITEIGTDMSTRFMGGIGKGNPHLQSALCETAWALSRYRNQPLVSKFWSLAARRGKKKALIATARRMLSIMFYMITRKEPFHEPQMN